MGKIGNLLSGLVQRGREAEEGAGRGAVAGEAESFRRGRLRKQDEIDAADRELQRALTRARTGQANRGNRPRAITPPKPPAPRNPNEVPTLIRNRIDGLYNGVRDAPGLDEQAAQLGLTPEQLAAETVFRLAGTDEVLGEHVKNGSVTLATVAGAESRRRRAERPGGIAELLQSFIASQTEGGGVLPGAESGGAVIPPPSNERPTDSAGRVIVTETEKARLEQANAWDDSLFVVGSATP